MPDDYDARRYGYHDDSRVNLTPLDNGRSSSSQSRDYRGRRTGRRIRKVDEDAYKRAGRNRSSRTYEPRPQSAARTRTAPKRKTNRAAAARMFAFSNRGESNFNILSCVLILLMIGLIMVTSSSYYYAYISTGNSLYFFRRQFIWILVSLIAMVLVMLLARMDWLRRWSAVIYLVSVFFCVLVLFVGHTANGSTRWLGVGGLSFQPSEFAKLAVAIYVSHLTALEGKRLQTPRVFFAMLLVIGFPSILVAAENLTSGIIVASVGISIMFMGGMKPKHILILFGLAALVGFMVVLPLFVKTESMPGLLRSFFERYMYRTNRIKAWIDPWSYALDEGYQTVQSLYAVGSGGFFGRGLGQSIQKLGYIPEAYNDIIFAIICEELGVFGALMVVILFMIFAYNGYRVSRYAPNHFSAYLSGGLVTQITLQAILNIAVNTNMIPATGVSLPFISYGGSSMLFLMVSVGLILNISMYVSHPEKA